jgi:NAD(P)-dependent dehydrogenase (short-subunit alcohol dehydrogenase family)
MGTGRVADKTVVVTGSGMGRALAREGAVVGVLGGDASAAEKVTAQITEDGLSGAAWSLTSPAVMGLSPRSSNSPTTPGRST